jgi:predicted secreted hydrolase
MAHFALSDIEGESFHAFERLNRAGVGWSGAETASYRVWNEDWEAHLEGGIHILRARDGDYQIDLRLKPAKPIVVHGIDGVSQKGALAGNASHYYSLTRMETSGKIIAGGEALDVEGLSWMDHEFGTSFLEAEQVGWDWFSIQLDDGRELMLFELRRVDGSIDPRSSGTLIEADGGALHLSLEDFRLTPGNAWRSEASGATYPTAWRIEIPRYDLRLDVRAAFAGQELRTAESAGVTYWEGSTEITGGEGERKLTGRGYLEMTGYAGQSMGAIMRR